MTDNCVKRRDKKPGGLQWGRMTNVLGMNGCLKNRMMREFLGGTMVRTLYFYSRGHRFNIWSGN